MWMHPTASILYCLLSRNSTYFTFIAYMLCIYVCQLFVGWGERKQGNKCFLFFASPSFLSWVGFVHRKPNINFPSISHLSRRSSFSPPIILSLFYNASLSLLSISVQPTYLAEAKCITIQVEVSLDFLICSVLTSLTPVVTSKIIFSFLCRTFIFPFLRFEWSLENDFVWREKNC